jgi:hypothetical protein
MTQFRTENGAQAAAARRRPAAAAAFGTSLPRVPSSGGNDKGDGTETDPGA